MRVAPWLCVVALAGCAGQAGVRLGTSVSSVPPGTAVSGSSVGVQAQSGSAAGALIAIGILAAAWYGEENGRQAVDSGFGIPGPVPPLDATRRVNEQDCTQPIEDRAANLRCK